MAVDRATELLLRLRLPAGLLAAAALAGCAGTSTSTIDITDRGVFVPSARMSFDIPARADRPAEPHSAHGIELGLSGGSGDDTQSVGTGQRPVVLGGQTFAAPAELKHEFEFRFAEVAYRYRRFFGAGGFGIEALGGLAHASLDMTVASASRSAAQKMDSSGPVGGFCLIWRLRPATSLQSRLALYLSGADDGVSEASRLDFFLAHALGRNVALRGGYVIWHVEAEGGGSSSNVRVRFAGPALGLDIAF